MAKKPTYEELSKKVDALEKEKASRDSEERYRYLIESSPDAIAVVQDERHRLINSEFTKLFGFTQQELDRDTTSFKTIREQDKDMIRRRIKMRLAGEKISSEKWVSNFVAKDGGIFPCETSANVIQFNGRPAILVIIRDITERKQAEEALRKSKEELRTKAHDLQEVNTALRVLIKQRADDKVDLEKKVLLNIEQRIQPLIQRIKGCKLDFRPKSFVNILESNVNEIVSSFSFRLNSRPEKITPAEIQICNLIKHGKTSREIADLLCVSDRTVAAHRRNIRRKFGIKNKKQNLRAYLLALEND
jgi:PAS domain S-box-containing protein